MIKDLTEMFKMILIIFLWLGAYSISLEIVKAYANRPIDCKMDPDFIPSVEDSNKSENVDNNVENKTDFNIVKVGKNE